MKVLRLKKLSWSRKCTVLFNTLLKPFLILAVKCSLQNTPYFSFSPFEHWQVDNRNVLDSQSAAGDDIWEGEWAALFLHDRFPLQDQKAGLNSLLKGPGQENHLRESTAHYSAHQQNPVFFLFILEEEEWLLHTALCLQVCICSRAKVTSAQTPSGLFLWVVWAQAVLWWNNYFSAICLKSHFQKLRFFQKNHYWSAFEQGLASSYLCNSWDGRTFTCSPLSITESRAGQGEQETALEDQGSWSSAGKVFSGVFPRSKIWQCGCFLLLGELPVCPAQSLTH